MSKLVYNAIRTPDGTVLESTHVHDYKTYIDKITNQMYMVDGGCEYLRRNGVPRSMAAEELSLYDTDYIGDIRKLWTWGTYGVTGENHYQRVKLMDMSDAHIKAICSQEQYAHVHALLKRELGHRADYKRAQS